MSRINQPSTRHAPTRHILKSLHRLLDKIIAFKSTDRDAEYLQRHKISFSNRGVQESAIYLYRISNTFYKRRIYIHDYILRTFAVGFQMCNLYFYGLNGTCSNFDIGPFRRISTTESVVVVSLNECI